MSDGYPKNFSPEEFACKCGCGKMPHPDRMRHLAWVLQYLRPNVGPITINSAFRCPEHNSAVGGAKRSQHLECTAADIVCSNRSPDDLADMIESLMDCGVIPSGGVGRYNTFTHVDIRNTPARWDNRS